MTNFGVLTKSVDEDVQNLPMVPCLAPASRMVPAGAITVWGGMGPNPPVTLEDKILLCFIYGYSFLF